jgi:hypothetical protein
MLRDLEKVRQRRKAVIYISSGYDFNPFEASRLEEQAHRANVDPADLQNDPFVRAEQGRTAAGGGDLVRETA